VSSEDTLVERTTLWNIIVSLAVTGFGIALLFAAAKLQWMIDHPGTQSVARSLAGFLIVSVAIAMLWQLRIKRAFLEEVMAKARLAEEVRAAGVVTLTRNESTIDWTSYFKNVRKLDIFFSYGSTWRHSRITELRTLAERGECRIRIILPDPDNQTIIEELAGRFNTKRENLKEKIKEAVEEFTSVFGQDSKVSFELYYIQRVPLFTYYRFDDLCIASFYNHQKDYQQVPFIVSAKPGTFYEFFRNDFAYFMDHKDEILRRVNLPKTKEIVGAAAELGEG
jgi:hypothetical protein